MKKIIILLCLAATFAQAQEDVNQNDIKATLDRYKTVLLKRGVDTFWVYEPAWSKPALLMVLDDDTSYTIAAVKYLYWQEKSEFYRQRFESCAALRKTNWTNVSNVVKIPKSAFSKTINSAFSTIAKTQIYPPEYNDLANNSSTIVDFEDITFSTFEFHLKDSVYKKCFSDVYLSEEYKYNDSQLNEHYYPNHKTILYKLIDWDLSDKFPKSTLLERGVDTFWIYTNSCKDTKIVSGDEREITTKQLYFIEKGVLYRQSFEYDGIYQYECQL